jgi:Ca2+-binding EF-hand superfamily protein
LILINYFKAKLSNEVLSDLKKAFEEYDLNSDGKIDKTEFMNLFNKQGLDFTEKELKGFVSYEMFHMKSL